MNRNKKLLEERNVSLKYQEDKINELNKNFSYYKSIYNSINSKNSNFTETTINDCI